MKKGIILAALVLLFIGLASVYAQSVATAGDGLLFQPEETVATDTQKRQSEPLFLEDTIASFPQFPSDPFGASLRIISSLFAVILLAFAASWFIQKKAGFGGNAFGRILGVLPLDNRRMIYLVDVMGRVLILGVTDSNINLLCELDDADTLNTLRLQYEKPSPGLEKLFSFIRPQERNPDESAELEPTSSQNKNQERLKKLNDLLVKRTTRDENSQG